MYCVVDGRDDDFLSGGKSPHVRPRLCYKTVSKPCLPRKGQFRLNVQSGVNAFCPVRKLWTSCDRAEIRHHTLNNALIQKHLPEEFTVNTVHLWYKPIQVCTHFEWKTGCEIWRTWWYNLCPWRVAKCHRLAADPSNWNVAAGIQWRIKSGKKISMSWERSQGPCFLCASMICPVSVFYQLQPKLVSDCSGGW